MKTTFGNADRDAPVKDEGPTAEDWIRLQQMDPRVEAAMLASLKGGTAATVSQGPTAEDWIRIQQMDPATERYLLASLKRDTGPKATAEDWLRAQGMPPEVEREKLGELKTNTVGTATAADWIRAQGMDPAVEKHMMESIYGKAPPREAPATVESPKGTSAGAFVKGLIRKAFNFGAVRREGANPAAATPVKPAATGAKQKSPGA